MVLPLPRTGLRRRASLHPCNRPGCWQDAVVTLGWDNTVALSFCIAHAEDKAGQAGVRILWLLADCDACRICWRIVPSRLLAEHFNLVGDVCHGEPAPRPSRA